MAATELMRDHWDKQWINVTGGRFPIPSSCPVCRSFDRLFVTEAMPGEIATYRERLTVGFRDAHHNPLYQMVDRDQHFMNRLKAGGWPSELLREIARMIALVGPECGRTRPLELDAPLERKK